MQFTVLPEEVPKAKIYNKGCRELAKFHKESRHYLSQPTESSTMYFLPSTNLVEKYLVFQLKQQPSNGYGSQDLSPWRFLMEWEKKVSKDAQAGQ